MRLVLSYDEWVEKYLRVDLALEHLDSDRACHGDLDCLDRAEVAATVDVEGCVYVLGLCLDHAAALTEGTEGVRVLGTRPLAEDESLSLPDG